MKAYVIQPAGGRASYDLGDCEKSIELSAPAGRLADETKSADWDDTLTRRPLDSAISPDWGAPLRTDKLMGPSPTLPFRKQFVSFFTASTLDNF
jgi:hypothetical protein